MTLFPETEPYQTGRLNTADGHDLYWERAGKPGGVPALFLHGGPGSGCTPRHRRFFDPAVFDAVLFDQRGAGRSRPHLSLENNDTGRLIADIEALRAHLKLDRWIVFGPSWGSTLALAYAQAHPARVSGLLVEGVFLGSAAEAAWLYGPDGAARFFPDAYAAFIAPVPDSVRGGTDKLIAWHYAQMRREWAAGAPDLQKLSDPAAPLAALRRSPLYRWTEYEERLSYLDQDAAAARAGLAARGPDFVAAHSLIEAHYFAHECFLAPEQLLRDAARLRDIPMHIVQSRYDMVCPPAAAFRLAAACPQTKLAIVPVNGHAMTDAAFPAVTAALADLAKRAS